MQQYLFRPRWLRFLACTFLGVGSGLLVSCQPEGPAGNKAERLIPSVEAVQSRYGSLPLTQRLSGTVEARNQIGVYAQISAVVTEVLVHDGDTVEKGQPLVRLRDTEYRERLKQAHASHRIAQAELRRAQAQLKEAKAELSRTRSLEEKGLTSATEVETVEARAESAEAEVELAQARVQQALANAQEQEENLTQAEIRAPIAGSIGDRNAEVGMLASPSTHLLTLGQLDSVRVEVVLTDRMLSYIEEGQRAEISVAGAVRSAALSRISPFLNPVAHSTEAQIDLANPGLSLKPGMFVTVDVFYGESEEATLVPMSALYEHPSTGVVGVYVTKESLEPEPVDERGIPTSMSLTDPIDFEFVPADVVAEGRMEAAVRGVEPDTWVVTMGQHLLGGEAGQAKVRPVPWDRVERLQRLQREDLMRELVEQKAAKAP